MVRDFDELKAQAAQVKGRIVLFDVRFDQDMADRGHAGQAYGQVTRYRGGGTTPGLVPFRPPADAPGRVAEREVERHLGRQRRVGMVAAEMLRAALLAAALAEQGEAERITPKR